MTTPTRSEWQFTRRLIFWALLLALHLPVLAARLEIIKFESRVLKDNPLHDPTLRSVAVFLPSQAVAGERLPVVYYLPGYGGGPLRRNFRRQPMACAASLPAIRAAVSARFDSAVRGKNCLTR